MAQKKLVELEKLSLFKTKQDEANDKKFIKLSDKGVTIATLESGKIPLSQIPATAITDVFVVDSQQAMLGLTAQKGDIAIRTDVNKTFILKIDGASTLDNWTELLVNTGGSVISVNGMTGVVVISDATTSKSGLMSGGDKTKLDGLKNFTLSPATNSALGGVKIGTGIKVIADGTISVENASATVDGLMSKEDKIKLDEITYATDEDINGLF